MPPVRPMLAKAAHDVPRAEGLRFEPKWDGFRCIVFRDGDEVELGSRNDRPLTRYFPEMPEPLKAALPERCVVDGEIVLVGADGLDFDALQQRIHPAGLPHQHAGRGHARPASWPSTCWRSTTATCAASRSTSAAACSSRWSTRRTPRCGSRR